MTMCSAFTPDCGNDNSTIILIGDVFYPNTESSGKLCLHKKTFNLSAEAIINVRNVRLCARFAIFFSKIKQIPFSCRLPRAKGLTFLKRVRNQFKMLLEMCIVLASKYFFNREECESFDGYVTTPRSIYGCGKCAPGCSFTKLTSCFRSTIDDRNRQNALFLCLKKMNLVPNKQLLSNIPIQPAKYRKKDLCVDNKVQEPIEDVYCPTCRNEKCV